MEDLFFRLPFIIFVSKGSNFFYPFLCLTLKINSFFISNGTLSSLKMMLSQLMILPLRHFKKECLLLRYEAIIATFYWHYSHFYGIFVTRHWKFWCMLKRRLVVDDNFAIQTLEAVPRVTVKLTWYLSICHIVISRNNIYYRLLTLFESLQLF